MSEITRYEYHFSLIPYFKIENYLATYIVGVRYASLRNPDY